MKTILGIFMAVFVCVSVQAQAPIRRNVYTTNSAPGAAMTSTNAVTPIDMLVVTIGTNTFKIAISNFFRGPITIGDAQYFVPPSTLNVAGYRPPFLTLATDTGALESIVLASGTNNYVPEIIFMASNGSLAAPTNNWVGGIGAFAAVGWVGGAVQDWRTFSFIEFGNRGANPASESDVKGRIQLSNANGLGPAPESRPGLVVYNDQVLLTDFLPFYMYRVGMSNTFNGSSFNDEMGVMKWIGTNWVIGTEFHGTNINVNPIQFEVGNVLTAQLGADGFTLSSNKSFAWSSGTASPGTILPIEDLFLSRDAANTLAQRNGTNRQSFGVYNTYSSPTNYERFSIRWNALGTVGIVGMEKGSAGGSTRVYQFENGTDPVFQVDGNNGISLSAGYQLAWSSTTPAVGTAFLAPDNRLYRSGAGILTFDNNASGWGRINFGGTTAAFPSLKRVNGNLEVSDGAGTGTTNNFIVPGIIIATNGFSGMRSNLLAPSSITFPATTDNWTNPLPVSIQVIIDNSAITGTAIKKNGTQIASQTVGTTTVGLQVGEYFSQTYTVGTPTAVYFPYP